MDSRMKGIHEREPQVRGRDPEERRRPANYTRRVRPSGCTETGTATSWQQGPHLMRRRRKVAGNAAPRSKAEGNSARLVRHIQARDARLATQHETHPPGGEVHEGREEA